MTKSYYKDGSDDLPPNESEGATHIILGGKFNETLFWKCDDNGNNNYDLVSIGIYGLYGHPSEQCYILGAQKPVFTGVWAGDMLLCRSEGWFGQNDTKCSRWKLCTGNISAYKFSQPHRLHWRSNHCDRSHCDADCKIPAGKRSLVLCYVERGDLENWCNGNRKDSTIDGFGTL